MLQEINKEILIYLNSLWNNQIIEKIVNTFIDLPIFFIPIFLIIFWVYYTHTEKLSSSNKSKKEDLLFIFYWTVIALVFSLLIQQIVHIERPENVINWVWKLLLKHIPDASFPSDHATVSFAFLTSLFIVNYKKIWFIFLPFVILMNLSRIIAWVHWPFDIIAWIIIWIIWAFISFKIFKKIIIINKFNKNIIKIMKYIKL